ncbi:MAG: hypothetical protein IJG65_02035 [Synergistaceae bacterium]|nr:hypothetical protein [Synergistaceae bacterium]
MGRNLIIGAVTNYGWNEVAPFFNSYARAGFGNCDCVMFVDGMTPKATDKMKATGIELIPIPERLKAGCVNDFRWELYTGYLKGHISDYDFVFTSDVRDAVFQDDVFNYCGDKPFLGIALEDGYLTENCNQNWLMTRYGAEVYGSMKNERIICTGTVWGTASEFLKFSSAMSGHINSNDYPYFRVCDQASGNWLIYHEKIFSDDFLVKSENSDGYVLTVGLTPGSSIHLDAEGNVLNGKGEIAAVIHQYDRKPEIIEAVLKKYSQEMTLIGRLNLRKDKTGKISRRISGFMRRSRKNGFIGTLLTAVRKIISR